MKRFLVLLLLLGTISALTWAAGQTEVQAKSKTSAGVAADKAAIEQLWVNYSKDAMDGNFDAFLALHEKDAYKMPENTPMFQIWANADAIRAKWAKRVQTYTMQMTIVPKEIVILTNDYAYSMGTYTQILMPKSGGAKTIFNGKFLDVLHKDADGKWRILRDCYNSNTPPA